VGDFFGLAKPAAKKSAQKRAVNAFGQVSFSGSGIKKLSKIPDSGLPQRKPDACV
jgi:hypothetical protein